MENESDVIFASSYSWSDERIEFSETDEKKNFSTYFLLEKISDTKTKLTIDFYIKKNVIFQFLFNLLQKKKIAEMFAVHLGKAFIFIVFHSECFDDPMSGDGFVEVGGDIRHCFPLR